MKLLDSALKLFATYFRVEGETLDYFFKTAWLGQTPGRALPYASELVPIGARLWLRGWFNNQAADTLHNWILPYWMTRQADPTDRAFIARMSNPTMLNQNLRDWSAVGNLAREREALVDPRGLITPWDNGWSLDAWVAIRTAALPSPSSGTRVLSSEEEGMGEVEMFFPSQLTDDQIEQHLHENLPVVITQYEAARLRVKHEVFAVQDADNNEWVVSSYTIENPRNEPRRATLYLSLRPFNPEGASLVKQIEYRASDATGVLFVNDALALVVPEPQRVVLSNHRAGDVAWQIPSLLAPSPLVEGAGRGGGSRIECDAGLATALAQYDLDLAPNSSRTILALMSLQAKPVENDQLTVPAALKTETARTLREQTITTWQEKLAHGMRVSLPDTRMNDAFEANKTHLLLLHDGDSITPGPFLYHQFWMRDAAFMLHALDTLGYHDEVAQVLKKFPRRIRKDGFFNSQNGEWDANGQALWTWIEHARLSGDWESVREPYWGLLNLAHWIDNTRQKTKMGDAQTRVAHWGLLPAGFSAEHFGPADYYYWDDFWGAAGLRDLAWLAEVFGQQGDAKKLREQFDTFRAEIDHSLARVAERVGSSAMPASPYRQLDSAMIGTLSALYPLRLFDAYDARVTATLERLMQTSWLEDAFFHHVGHTAFGTYLSLDVADCLLFRRDPRAWKIIEWVLRHASPTFAWAEGVHPLTRRGGMGDGLHGWASADWIHTLRNALLFEEGNVLVLTPALPREWTAETTVMRVENAPTHFGNVSFTLAFGSQRSPEGTEQNAATLVLKAEWRARPEYIEWNFPFPIKQAGTEEHGLEIVGNAVRIPPEAKRIVAMW